MAILVFIHSLEKRSALLTYFEWYLYLYHVPDSTCSYLRL